MKWLNAYRHQLAEEAAGNSHRFADILGYFRKFWHFTIVLAVAFFGLGVWKSLSLTDETAGMALIVFPFGALLLVVAGAIPYKLAQLFLSVQPSRGSDRG